jgi:hypothetical protein
MYTAWFYTYVFKPGQMGQMNLNFVWRQLFLRRGAHCEKLNQANADFLSLPFSRRSAGALVLNYFLLHLTKGLRSLVLMALIISQKPPCAFPTLPAQVISLLSFSAQ